MTNTFILSLSEDDIKFLRKLAKNKFPYQTLIRAILRASQDLDIELLGVRNEKDLSERIQQAIQRGHIRQ